MDNSSRLICRHFGHRPAILGLHQWPRRGDFCFDMDIALWPPIAEDGLVAFDQRWSADGIAQSYYSDLGPSSLLGSSGPSYTYITFST